jgi:hypothetical protein
MLHYLLLEEMAVLAFGDDLHRVILNCRIVETVPTTFPMIEHHDECDPHTPLWISQSSWMPSSLEIHLIIMLLVPHRYNTLSIRWYILDLCAMCSTSALSSDGGWLSRNALIGLIQSYIASCSSSLITIRSGLTASISSSVGLTEDLDNFSIMVSGGASALEEAIYAR